MMAPAPADLASIASLWANGAVLVLAAVGILFRHRRRIHPPIMLAALAIDVANVAWVEARRGAVEKAVEATMGGGSGVLLVHIASSAVTAACWCLAVATGLRLLRGRAGRAVHRVNLPAFLAARTVNFITAFMV